MEELAKNLYEQARQRRDERTYDAHSFDEMKELADTKPGFIRAMWCGDRACEEKIKEEAGLSSRCMPFAQEEIEETCVCCGKKAHKLVFWGKAY